MSRSLRDCLMDIYIQHQELTPDLVVDEARNPEHPLHHRFEWDDAIAAEGFRREQARSLIQSVKVSFIPPSGEPSEIRTFHAVRKNEGRVYRPIDEIVKDDVATAILLQEMDRDWKRLKARYGHLIEFQKMIAAEQLQTVEAS